MQKLDEFANIPAAHLDVQAVGASPRSAGKKYEDACPWKQSFPMTKRIAELVVRKCEPQEFEDCDVIFSGLDSRSAGDIGESHSKNLLTISRRHEWPQLEFAISISRL